MSWVTKSTVMRSRRQTDSSRSFRSERVRSEEHTSELQSRLHLVCRLLLEKKNKKIYQVDLLLVSPIKAFTSYHHNTTALQLYILYVKNLSNGELLCNSVSLVILALALASD